jgi:hypothetical protein
LTMNSRKGDGRQPSCRSAGTSRLAGHASRDGFPMKELWHAGFLTAILRHFRMFPEFLQSHQFHRYRRESSI